MLGATGYAEGTFPDKRQLVLELNDLRLRIPWEGRCPRGLTKGSKLLFLRQEPPKSVSEFVDPEQGDLFKRRPQSTLGPLPYFP